MEKLKAKHDHTLTDILKVLIFAIVLLIPGFMFLPSMLYFGFNEQANAPVKQVQIQENLEVNFNQLFDESILEPKSTLSLNVFDNGAVKISGTSTTDVYWSSVFNIGSERYGHIFIYKMFAYDGTKQFAYLDYPFEGINIVLRKQITTNRPVNWKVFKDVAVDFTFYPQVFDLTQMFGEGNEPTIEQFNTYFTNNYYPYTESEKIVLTVEGSTEEVVDITTQLEWNWEQIWQRPILSWTKYSILKQGLDAFTNVFGVLQTSYITNLIAYELIMVAIYIVIDIVLEMFKWLTHLIGTK